MTRPLCAALFVLGAVMVAAAPVPAAEDEAVSRGVAHLRGLQAPDGSWPTASPGAAALVGLTLLECDVPATDPAVQHAATYLRKVWTDINDLHTTYALALTLLFFDRLGDPADMPIIQALGVRLLGGQNALGGWSYQCPELTKEEVRKLRSLAERQAELKADGQIPKAGTHLPRSRAELPREIRRLLTEFERKGPMKPGILDAAAGGGGDNSNTQFAVIALWAARRQGVPVDKALANTATRFRTTQHPDGGWGYMPALGNMPRFGAATPSMTCAGLLGLALGYGSAREAALRTEGSSGGARGGKKMLDPAKDPVIRAGFRFLSKTIGQQRLDDINSDPDGLGDMYYLLWSIERVAVAYGLPRIGDKDWYAWGARLVVAAQRGDGGWKGRWGTDIDTSFALLFLRRANLSSDLSAYLRGQAQELANVSLRAGGVMAGGNGKDSTAKANPEPADAVQPPAKPKTIPEPAPAASGPRGNRPANEQTARSRPPSRPPENPPANEAERLSAELVKAVGRRQEEVLERLKEAKGVVNTEALATAIPQLSGAMKTRAREALAERLARMTAATLRDKLQDEAPEIRRAAALACAVKADKQFVPDLIPLLEDQQGSVVRAAHAALKDLTGQDLGPTGDANAAARTRAASAWKEWWKKQGGR